MLNTFDYENLLLKNIKTLKSVGLGHIGLFLDGVSIYNPDDAQSYNNLGVWKRNALFWEGPSFDSCKGIKTF